MLVLGLTQNSLSAHDKALLDPLILAVLATPIIYQWIIKPYVIAHGQAVEKMTYLAFHDSLTQLANRRMLTEYLQKILARLGRHGHCGAVILIDLDDFKPINDKLGHDVGDTILVEVAARLMAVMREEDVAGRLGGDEFMVLLDYLALDTDTARQQALMIAQRIQETIALPIKLKQTFRLGASIGIRMLDNERTSIETIIKQADIAMYRAKNQGKGNIVVYE